MIKSHWTRIWKKSAAAGLSAAILFTVSAALPPNDAAGKLSPLTASAASPAFTDTSSHWAASTIAWALQKGIVDGYADNTFRPNQPVSEPEFLAMLLRAYPDRPEGLNTAAANTGDWSAPYYHIADSIGWPVQHSASAEKYNRGHVALLIAATQQKTSSQDQAIAYLLQHGLASGKTDATVQGFGAADQLTRAEALQFIRNLLDKQVDLWAYGTASNAAGPSGGTPSPEPAVEPVQSREIAVRGISIGDTESSVVSKLGKPARKDLSEYGFYWYIYNADYSNYAMIGIQDGSVVGLYSTSDNWQTDKGVKAGSAKDIVKKLYGQPDISIKKGRTEYVLNDSKGESSLYKIGNSYVTFFYDLHQNGIVTSVQVIAEQTEQGLDGFYGTASAELVNSYEREILDLANAARVKFGKPALAWSDLAAASARKHAQDMAVNNFFAHNNLQGQTPFDRMKAEGIKYSLAAENIAAGQTSAIFAHEGWMNSEGHRTNLLGDTTQLGVGVYFGGSMNIYYGQNFFTPR